MRKKHKHTDTHILVWSFMSNKLKKTNKPKPGAKIPAHFPPEDCHAFEKHRVHPHKQCCLKQDGGGWGREGKESSRGWNSF